MSLSALAEEELLRTDRSNLNLAPVINANLGGVLASLNLDSQSVDRVKAAAKPVAEASPIQKPKGENDAFDALVKYIPTETVTLYLAAANIQKSLTEVFPLVTPLFLYGLFTALTPILFLVIYVGKRRSQQLSFLPGPADWPLWKLIASTIAFAVWALTISPLIDTDALKAVVGFFALVVSFFLSALDKIFAPEKA